MAQVPERTRATPRDKGRTLMGTVTCLTLLSLAESYEQMATTMDSLSRDNA